MTTSENIDLLVEFLPSTGIDLDLTQLLGRKVDLVAKNGLKPLIRASVLAEAQLMFAA